ncbi:hypothetical protein DPM19_00030 [Actinomadura craniellae]|uniref:Uncharacterized protein n=1 Tax=Actinomadura craniellae TaxID=2231787 RepID=A0A365HC55_9ACTN|nr:hypothetical protein [Actinomadura craniellae]RAY16619.1 hypothetical protein DPM19_00030 [Actinomadura craniellae]
MGCPVCNRKIETGPACRHCGWALETPWWFADEPEAEQRRFDERLARARRAFDAVAMARVSPIEGRWSRCIRGGAPDEREWAQAVRAARPAQRPADVAPQEALSDALADLGGEDGLTVIEVGGQGIAVFAVSPDRQGALRGGPAGAPAPWTELLPMLAAAPEERSFQLAGGLAGFDHDRLWAALETAVLEIAGTLPEGPTVVLCGVPGWPVPERAVELLRLNRTGAQVVRGALPEIGGLLDELIAAGPLRQAYELVLAVVDPESRRIGLRSRPLFSAGARTGDEASLTVYCAPSDADGTVFAVVTWKGNREPRPLSVSSVKLPPGPHQVRAVLEAAGRIRFLEPAGLSPDPRSWATLVGLVPERYDPPAPAVDLICAVELAGDRDDVEARLRLLRGLVKLLDGEAAEPGRLRIALLGYGAHAFDSRLGEGKVVRGAWLAPPAEVLGSISRLRYAGPGYPAAAPVEDMLVQVAGRWRPADGRKAVLLTVGGRSPHPAEAGEHAVHPCPHGHDWDRLLGRLERAGLARVAVVDRPQGGAQNVWPRLGDTALHGLADADPRQLGIDIGVLAPRDSRLPFPLPTKTRYADEP